MVSPRLVTLILVTSLMSSAVAIGIGGAATDDNDSSFAVTITDINTPVVQGETAVIEATITNTGSEEGSEQIHLKQNDTIVDSVKNPSLTLAPGESADVILEWTPEYGETGPAALAVWSDENHAVRTIDVGQGPTFPVAIDETSDPILGGESLTVSVTVRNTGNTTDATPVELSVANERLAQQRVELAPGEKKQIDLTWETAENDTGTHTVEVSSADGATESQVRISHSGEVVPAETASDQATETTGDESKNAVMSKIVDSGFGIAVALVALLVVVLVGFGLRRN